MQRSENENIPQPTKLQLLRGYLIYIILKAIIFFGTAFSTLMILFKLFNMTSMSWWIILSPISLFIGFLFISFASIGAFSVMAQIKALKEIELQNRVLDVFNINKKGVETDDTK